MTSLRDLREQSQEFCDTCKLNFRELKVSTKDWVTAREIRLPLGNRKSRAPSVKVVTGQKIPNYFENFEFKHPYHDIKLAFLL